MIKVVKVIAALMFIGGFLGAYFFVGIVDYSNDWSVMPQIIISLFVMALGTLIANVIEKE